MERNKAGRDKEEGVSGVQFYIVRLCFIALRFIAPQDVAVFTS